MFSRSANGQRPTANGQAYKKQLLWAVGGRLLAASQQRVFTLVEAIVAMTIFVIGVVGLIQVSLLAKSTSEQGRDTVQASNYLQEGMEAVRAIRDSAWANIATPGNYHLVPQPGSNPAWQLVADSAGGSETIGKFTRKVAIADVYREDTVVPNNAFDAGERVVLNCPTPGTGACYLHADTKKITVTMTWTQGSRAVTRSVFSYLTNWH